MPHDQGRRLSPLVVYDWFKCRVTDDGSGWMLEKTSGSQRTKGRFFDDGDKRLTYLGSFYVDWRSGQALWQRPRERSIRLRVPDRRQAIPHRIAGTPGYELKLDILEFRR